MPAKRGDAHQASTSLTWASYSASSASPAFCDSGSSWNESAGGAAW